MLATMLAFTARGQVLQNTLWREYTLTNIPSLYWYFGQDTIFKSVDNISFNHISIYTTISNLITIIDPPFNDCPVTDTGIYNFLVQSDTLRFSFISDPCNYRQSVFSLHYFLQLTTGITNINPISTANISPNPSPEGIFNVSFNGNNKLPKRIYVLSADGRKILEENYSSAATNHIIHLQSCAPGIYFLVMENDLGRKVAKLVK